MSTALSEDLDRAGDMPDFSSCKKGFLNTKTYTHINIPLTIYETGKIYSSMIIKRYQFSVFGRWL